MVKLPAKLSNLVNSCCDEISSAVGIAVGSIGPLLLRNEAPFFSDYTDHGIQHVESVLRTCELLLSEEAWNEFTRQDAAVLIIATLAHDVGMLTNTDGFRELIKHSGLCPVEPGDLPWDKLWREFQLEVRRFDGATLINLTGSPEPVDIREIDPHSLSARGMKIVGEFLRRHHHRLAHEIVLYGMPSENGRVPLLDKIPEELRKLAGIVCRSHGLSVRECLETKSLTKLDATAHRQFRNIHPTFLMSIIRISDYLDLDIGRAPSSILSAKSLRSPISRREWWSHRVVIDCHSYDDDPDCLRIVVDSSALKDIGIFHVTEGKIKGIQEELDSCWAVLGEVYGRVAPLNKLNLKLRRLRSNLSDQSIIQQLPYVPYVASLQSASADLLKLLIEPLYGDRPSIGIRELIQNAVDAVREFEFIVSEKPSLSTVDREQLKGDVVVFFEKDDQGATWVTVADRGIGMNWETVIKFYLTAGASFRKSDVWKKDFSDETGHSQVLRSGRFGVGVLAAFLLGDRIRVSTRHIEEQEDRGIQFEFGLDDTSIELRWVKRNAGTTVSVRSSELTISRLLNPKDIFSDYDWHSDNWDWYCLEKPTVIRLKKDGTEIKQKYKLPGTNGSLPTEWHQISVPEFQIVYWSYKNNLPKLVCNGIRIPNGGIDLDEEFNSSKSYYATDLTFRSPTISVFDPDGRLPLNLAREGLARKLVGFESALAEDITRNFIAFCLNRGPHSRMLNNDIWNSYTKLEFPGCHHSSRYFFDSRDGFGICDPWNISYFSSSKCLIIRRDRRIDRLPQPLLDYAIQTYGAIFAVASDSTFGSFDDWHRRLILHDTAECLPLFKNLRLRGLRIIMPNDWYSRLMKKQPKYIKELIQVEENASHDTVFKIGDISDSDSGLLSYVNNLNITGAYYESMTEVCFEPLSQRPNPKRVAQMWKEIIGGPVIPFEEIKRQEIIDGLDVRFHRHLAQWTKA